MISIVRKMLLLGGGIYFLLFLPRLFDIQRELFGVRDGNYLATLEIVFPILLLLLGDMWRRGNRKLAKTGFLVCFGLILISQAWFVHPTQIHDRASARLADWNEAALLYEQRIENGQLNTSDQDIRRQRLKEERQARELESQAADVRFNGDKTYFRSPYYANSFFGLGMIGILLGILNLVAPVRQR